MPGLVDIIMLKVVDGSVEVVQDMHSVEQDDNFGS
jgi:hypothetical protein